MLAPGTPCAAAGKHGCLVALGTSMAYLFSTVVTLLVLDQHVYFEASAAIITLVLLGKLMGALKNVSSH